MKQTWTYTCEGWREWVKIGGLSSSYLATATCHLNAGDTICSAGTRYSTTANRNKSISRPITTSTSHAARPLNDLILIELIREISARLFHPRARHGQPRPLPRIVGRNCLEGEGGLGWHLDVRGVNGRFVAWRWGSARCARADEVIGAWVGVISVTWPDFILIPLRRHAHVIHRDVIMATWHFDGQFQPCVFLLKDFFNYRRPCPWPIGSNIPQNFLEFKAKITQVINIHIFIPSLGISWSARTTDLTEMKF